MREVACRWRRSNVTSSDGSQTPSSFQSIQPSSTPVVEAVTTIDLIVAAPLAWLIR